MTINLATQLQPPDITAVVSGMGLSLGWESKLNMKVLYVTSLWSGFKDIVFEGREEATGMPAFIYPLKKLIELGHQVDFVVTVPIPKPILNINLEWLKESGFHFVSWKSKGFQRVFSVIRLYFYIRNLLRLKEYDFVYGQGSVGSIGCLVANRCGLPCGQRLYGTFLAEEVSKKTKYYTTLNHPLEYMAFRIPKNFLLITNDGTKGDHVYKKLAGKSNYDFHFLLNGVDLSNANGNFNDIKMRKQKDTQQQFLFFPARIARWKQQHLAVDILKYLHDKGNVDIHLYFAGHIHDPDYWAEISFAAKEKGMEGYVHYVGKLGRQNLFKYLHNSIAVLSLYQFSNLGNVVIEALSVGAVVVAIDDGSLIGVVEDGTNGILIHTAEEAAERINRLLKKPDQASLIGNRAKEMAVEQFLSWENRAMKEVNIIEESIKKQDGKY